MSDHVGVFEGIVHELLGRLFRGRRVRIALRLFWGCFGAALGVLGCVKLGFDPGLTGNVLLRVGVVGLFASLALISLVNIALARRVLWPTIAFGASLAGAFIARILLGP